MIDRDWANSPAHLLRQKIEHAENEAIRAIVRRDKDKFKIAMLELAKLYDEEK
jgi:hypothetical protein